MGNEVIGVGSNVVTTDDNWTELEFKIWVPLPNVNVVLHKESINNERVGERMRYVPRRVPATTMATITIPGEQTQYSSQAIPQDRLRSKTRSNLGDPVVAEREGPKQEIVADDKAHGEIVADDKAHGGHHWHKRADVGDPVTVDTGRTTQETTIPGYCAEQSREFRTYTFEPEFPEDYFQPKLEIGAEDGDHVAPRPKFRTYKFGPESSEGRLLPKLQETTAHDQDELENYHGPQKRANLGDQVTADKGKAIQESTRPPRVQHVKGVAVQKTQQNNQVAIDIQNLAQSMRDQLDILNPISNFLCIYRVLGHLHDLNENAYTPHAIFIGPFHHGEAKLATIEDVKKRYLQHFLTRNNVTLEQLFEETLKIELKLRGCYAEKIEFTSQDFVTMMVIDGCFVVEYLLRRHFRDWESNDPDFNKQRLTNTIRFDLLLLENQIPFFYLDKLFSMSNNEKIRRGSISMVKLVRRFLEESTGWDWLAKDFDENQEIEVQHILHLLSICLFPKEPQKGQALKIRASPTIVELHSAGVKFRSSSNRHFLDIQFKDGILDIPTWKINDGTEILFRNLLAFELCNPPQHYLSDYVAFVDMLINIESDVELLVRSGVIENLLQHNQSVAELVNNLGKNNVIYDQDFYFSSLVDELKSYCERPWHKWKATLNQEYFKNPWTVISVIAAAFLLLLTILQSVCSVLQVLLA